MHLCIHAFMREVRDAGKKRLAVKEGMQVSKCMNGVEANRSPTRRISRIKVRVPFF